jgi:shikimate kinase
VTLKETLKESDSDVNPQIVFLCGFMGVGKSTIGLLLAKKLGWSFVDTDALITEKTKKTIPEIFASEGEAAFRKYEHEVLTQSSWNSPSLVSLGGGILLNPQNLKWICQKGWLIYMAANSETIISRLTETAQRRPLLDGLSENQRREKIQTLMKERQAQYAQAHHWIETDGRSPEEITNQIADQISFWFQEKAR